MKIKTSITLSESILSEIDTIISPDGNRSTFIENAISYYLKHRKQNLRDRNDIEIINNNSDDLNKEAEEILLYQVKS